MSFYNPYHFVPLNKKVNGDARQDVPYQTIAEGKSHIRHDGWPGKYDGQALLSGRIITKLTTKTPTIVGNQHTPGGKGDRGSEKPSQIEPYTYDGNVAIPGSSLRGMISSVAETLSQSAMRVLDNPTYSARVGMHGSDVLSAMGQLVITQGKHGQQQYAILPLKLPSLRVESNEINVPQKWLNAFGKHSTWKNSLGAYILGFNKTSDVATKEHFLAPNRNIPGSNPDSYNHEAPVFYAVKNTANLSNATLDFPLGSHQGYIKNECLLLAQSIVGEKNTRTGHVDDIRLLPENTPAGNDEIRGIVYALDRQAGSKDFPRNKSKQWFIPYNQKELEQRDTIPVPQYVIDTWHEIATLRLKDSDQEYPVFPKGITKHHGKQLREFKNGDIVYFDIEQHPNSGKIEVSAVSYSGIWRIPLGKAHRYFEHFTPWGAEDNLSAHREEQLSPAEQLFGTVEQDGGSRALASRIRISDAIAKTPQKYQDTNANRKILNVLASPKAPSPALYFKPTTTQNLNHHQRQNQHLSKEDLSRAHRNGQYENVQPNGWKRYLPRHNNQLKDSDWQETRNRSTIERLHLRMEATPIEPENIFYFTLDFDNLTLAELHLITTALSPQEGFSHRLGAGKSLGLGIVHVEPMRILTCDRGARYTTNSLSTETVNTYSRYHTAYRYSAEQTEDEQYLARRFIHAYGNTPTSSKSAGSMAVKSAEALFTDMDSTLRLVDDSTLSILCTLGNPNALNPTIPVTYPKTEAQLSALHNSDTSCGDAHSEGFEWFTTNENRHAAIQNQALGTITAATDTLPSLEANTRPDRNRRRY